MLRHRQAGGYGVKRAFIALPNLYAAWTGGSNINVPDQRARKTGLAAGNERSHVGALDGGDRPVRGAAH